MLLASILSVANTSLLLYVVVTIVPLILYSVSAFRYKVYKEFPTAGLNGSISFRDIEKARQNWLANGSEIVKEGLRKFSGCFQVMTTTGPKIVLRNEFADEIRNNPHLDFMQAISEDFFGHLPGFGPFNGDDDHKIIVETVRGRLTQSLNLITEELAKETSTALKSLCGQPQAWTEIPYKRLLLQVVARVSSYVFIGPELSANSDWLDVSTNYTIQLFEASNAVRQWHPTLRPIVHWFLPECRRLRGEVTRARQILEPVLRERREASFQARLVGQKTSKVADTIGWMDEAAKGEAYDVAMCQLKLSFAAIHTTTELITGIMTDLCSHPDWLDPLREEMVSAIKEHGWTKKALHEMKLVDSMMKESQRYHFGNYAMHRVATQSVKLSDGTVIPKGTATIVGVDGKSHDHSLFSDATSFQPRRFLEMRQKPGQENKWQFVTTSPEHLAFGHGMHSCPGRFFAANEAKAILIYLIVGFDWKFTAQPPKEDKFDGATTNTDPDAKALIRSREEDILI